MEHEFGSLLVGAINHYKGRMIEKQGKCRYDRLRLVSCGPDGLKLVFIKKKIRDFFFHVT